MRLALKSRSSNWDESERVREMEGELMTNMIRQCNEIANIRKYIHKQNESSFAHFREGRIQSKIIIRVFIKLNFFNEISPEDCLTRCILDKVALLFIFVASTLFAVVAKQNLLN